MRRRAGFTPRGVWRLVPLLLAAGCYPRPPLHGPPGPYTPPALPPSVWKPLLSTFEQQSVAMPKQKEQALLGKLEWTDRPSVKVAVVDWIPNRERLDAKAVHSDSVIAVVRNLACRGSTAAACGQRVVLQGRPTPASLDRVGARAESVPYAMTLAELAAAIGEALDAQTNAGNRLIISVSVGLDPIKLSVGNVSLEPLVKVLKRAACAGALVIAPAGNITGTEGPLIPASFESVAAPTAAECAAMGQAKVHGPTASSPLPARQPATAQGNRQAAGTPYAPLVYAVGALDPLDQRLFTVRPWGQPRLAAFGQSVSVPIPGDPGYSFPLSGGSMAAATVAGIAASVWNARPDLEPNQVMQHVYEGGLPLVPDHTSARAQTEFCLGHPAGPCSDSVRRVYLCGALKSAVDPTLVCTPKDPTGSFARPQWPQAKEPPTSPPPVPCTVSGCGYQTGPIAAQVPNGAVWQPYISGCPGCSVDYANARVSGVLSWYVVPAAIKTVVAKAYYFLQNTPFDWAVVPWSPTGSFSFPFSAPPGMSFIVLEVTFTNSDGLDVTEHALIFP